MILCYSSRDAEGMSRMKQRRGESVQKERGTSSETLKSWRAQAGLAALITRVRLIMILSTAIRSCLLLYIPMLLNAII